MKIGRAIGAFMFTKSLLVGIIIGLAVLAVTSAQTSRSVWDGVYTQEQATRGALSSGLCTQCHGDSFQGDPAPPLTGPDFLTKWDGRTVGDLFELIRQTMPDDDPGALSREQYADLLAYILSLNKFPSGSTELATDAKPLNEIRFEAKRQ
ncbi:MAG TPA: c-type cytochrome [Vicinamibacterales bacterium]